MRNYLFRINNTNRVWVIMTLLLLSISSTISCQDKTKDISKDPFLLYYLRNYPTIKIDNSKNVMIQYISYRDFDKKDIIYGDSERGTFWYSIYLFQNRVFSGIDRATTNNGRLLWRYKEIEINRDADGAIYSIDQYAIGQNRLLWRHTYKKNNNTIVANDGLRSGVIFAVLVEEESKYLFYEDHRMYNRTPDKPETTIEFIDNGDVIITSYNPLLQRDYSRFYFTNGILMKREYIGDRTETYTVSSGIGEIVITNTAGAVIERRMLERRINDAGYLEYEAVKYPSGPGHEYFITKDTLK